MTNAHQGKMVHLDLAVTFNDQMEDLLAEDEKQIV